ncbi:MAG: TIGR03790 family protein [Planctomycetota bacterium]
MCAALLLAPSASAQHGGERALLLVDPTDPDALHLANHYAALRDVPPVNVLYLDPDAVSYAALAAEPLRALRGELAQRGLSESIDFVVLAPSGSFFVEAAGLLADSCSPVTRMALPSAYGLYDYEALLLGPGTPSAQQVNGYARATWLAEGFRSELAWWNGLPSTGASARRYYIPASLGWLGARGNTKAELLAMIDRSVAVDGTAPTGTAYYMETTDPARSAPRHGLFPSAVTQMASAGGAAEHLLDVLPLGRLDALGVMTGWATPDIDGGTFTLLPGAFCDHLTSYAATFDTASQVKMSRWIAKGASGTAGTVEEPCNYASKFPSPRLHVLYRRGATLGEAWFRSMSGVPFQTLFTGDPLTTPWSLAPSVQVSGLGNGAVSGSVLLTIVAAPDALGGAAIAEVELFVDGARVARGPLAAGLTLETAALADGWHDVRVRATDDSAARNAGVWQGWALVQNSNASATCTPAVATGDLSTRFDLALDVQGGDVDEVVVLQGARVVARLDGASVQGGGSGGASGTVHVHGRNVGAGTVRLVAEGRFADGRRVRSAEVLLDVQDSEQALVGSAPIAYGYRRALATNDPCVLDLPASFEAALAGASYALVAPPAQAALLGAGGPSPAPYRVLAPLATARGIDLVGFEVTTAGGTSARAIVQLAYADGQVDARLACSAAANAFTPGARIGWSGSASIAADDLTLGFAGAPPSAFGLVFQGTGVARVPAGNGFLCVGANHARLGVVQASVGGAASFALDLAQPPAASAPVQPGDTRVFQLWYRDAVGAGYNFSDALVVTFTP